MNYYATAIEILMKSSQEKLAEIAGYVARDNPGIFIKAKLACDKQTDCPGQRRCRRETNKIPAIKTCRAETGKGLREAKQAVEGECPAWVGHLWVQR